MRTTAVLAVLMVLAPGLLADTRHVEVDEKADFSAFKTFMVREGQATSRKSEIDNPLTLKTIENSIRASLESKGLKDTPDRPDLVVTFSLVEKGQRGTVGRGIRNMQVVSRSAGTLVIEMTGRDARSVVWHGVYADDEANAAELARKLPDDAKKLISEYPPKKKKQGGYARYP